jgi:hypothetical protein
MIIIKIMGALDIITGILFWIFASFALFPSAILVLALILLVKGAIFLISKDIASIGDVICALLMLLALQISMPVFVGVLISLFLIQKGVFSLLR